MKKVLLSLSIFLLIGNISQVKAQCYGTVHFDQTVSPAPTSSSTNSFTINTTYCNELIMISYDGFSFSGGPGTGPITVDGNNATLIKSISNSQLPNSYTIGAETYAYIAPAAGAHAILVNESGYSATSGYDINFAADFYVTGTTNPLTIASLTSANNIVPCASFGPISATIATAIPNSMIYSNACYNDVSTSSQAISFTNANFLGDSHAGNGIEAADGYTSVGAPGSTTITANSTASNSSYCTGLLLILVAIPPPLCGTPLSVTSSFVNPQCNTSNGSISITPSGGAAPYTYAWTPAVSTTANATGLSAGTYTIIVSDAECPPADTTLVITLTTSGPQGIANMTVGVKCFGDCNATATETLTGGVPPYTYSWAPGGQTTATVTGLCVQTYTFTGTDNNGCSGTATVTVTQPPVLAVTDVATNALCNGGTGSITATPSGGTPPYTYSWNPSAQTAATATGLSAGLYITTVTDSNGCTATATATITQPTALAVSISGPLTLCANGTGTLTATASGGTAPYNYLWSTAATTSTASITLTATTTYSATITDANGCQTTGTFTVTLENPSVITLSASKGSICSGLSTTISASATNITGAFTWQPGNLSGAIISVTPTVTTTYTVTVPSFCGLATATITINVNQLPVTSFTTDNASGCYPLCVQFKNTSTSSTGNIIQSMWTFGNGDSAIESSPIFCYPKAGSYSVSLTTVTDSGCSSTLQVQNYINVYSRPNASFTMSPQPTTILQSTIQFTDNSTDAYGIAYWWWNFGVPGNDTVSNMQNPAYKYWDTGTYCPSEVVMNIHGCTDTATNCLDINPVFSLYIPSAFTPNGDGMNDVFEPKGNDVKSFEMYIYDRWGMQLFHTTDINNGWAGTVAGGSGSVCQEDTYVYVINAYDKKNQKHSYTGAVSLIK